MLRNSRQGRRTENIWPSAAANWWRARRLRAPRDAAILADACVNAAGRLVLVDSLKRGDCARLRRDLGAFSAELSRAVLVPPRELHRFDAMATNCGRNRMLSGPSNVWKNALDCTGGCSGGSPVGQRGSASPVLGSAGSVQQAAAVPAAVGRPFRLV